MTTCFASPTWSTATATCSPARATPTSRCANRLNSISKQLTIVATIFLALAFVTGFFGQNFKWMTDHIQSFASFAILGIGGLVSFSAALLIWFRRSGYL